MSGLVFGVGGSNHDFSAAIVDEGRVKVAIEDERVQRVKRGRADWHSQPARDAALYCLETAKLDLDAFDGIFCNDDLERPTEWLDWSRVTLVNHHTAHAAASFFTSPHEESALLVVDGHGSALVETERGWEVETISIGRAAGTSLDLIPLQTGVQKRTSSAWRYVTQNSIGWFYRIVTMAIGFGEAGQGKAMGLAAYGTPRLINDLSKFVEIGKDGHFGFDPYGGIWDWLNEQLARAENPVQLRADLAFAAQEIFVDAIVAAAQEAYRQAPSKVLSFGGGCALNTLANSRILETTPFEELAVFPAAGDNGLSVGAALYGSHVLLGHPRPGEAENQRGSAVYLGRHYSDPEIDSALADHPVLASRPLDLADAVARILADRRTVATCIKGSEIGPRALGHRSLLALPFSAGMRDHVNLNIKQRESFRPLAPVVPLEHFSTYFEGLEESPYMLLVARVREQYRDKLAAITHVDGTARVQTVRAADNDFLHQLLLKVGDLTDVPVLLNTSLNFPGKPIVETPADALELFIERPIDALVLGDRIVRKYSPWVSSENLPGATAR
jgi:carbamoyltransferase